MKEYYVNIVTDDFGCHEIHTRDCHRSSRDKKYLGTFQNAIDAVEVAKNIYDNCDACEFCSKEAHEG